MSQIETFAKLKVEADTSDLQRANNEIDKTKKNVDDLGSSAKKSSGDFSSFGAAAESAGSGVSGMALAAGAAVVAIGAVVAVASAAAGIFADLAKEAINAGDEMNDFSKQTNIATERLSLLKAAYATTGADLKEVIANSETLSAKLAKQDEQTGKVINAIDKLGVSTKDANGVQKSSLQLQEDIVVAADQMKDKQEGAALAVTALGTAYYKLRGPILDVKESQGELYDLMAKTGGLMSGEFAKASDNLNDKLTNLKTVFGGIGQTIASVALPALTAVAEKVLSVATAVAQAIARITGMNPATDKVNGALGDLNKQKSDAEATIAKLEASEYGKSAAGAKALQQQKERLAVLQDQVREMNRYKTATDAAAESDKKAALSGVAGEGNSTVSVKDPKGTKDKKAKEDKDELGDFARRELERQRKRDQHAEEAAHKEDQKGLDDWFKGYERKDKMMTRQADQMKAYIDQNYEVQKQIETVNKLQEEGYLTAEEAIKARSKLNDELIDSSETFAAGWNNAFKAFSKDATDSAKLGGDAFKSMANTVEGALDKFIETGKFSFSDFARSIIVDIGKIAAKQAASGIMGLLGGGSSGGSGIWGSIISGITGAFSGGGAGLGGLDASTVYGAGSGWASARALGGPMGIDQPTLVGEHGPEIIKARTPSTIVPNNALGGTTQQNNISINVTGSKDPEETARLTSIELQKIMKGIAKQEIKDATRSGNILNRR
ncbi:phage tail tape measure C-terminal domain-containing protein [Variovorax sp. J22R193]|uniref:phage tail tape measure C-terminal domain-containing protein n=1 Tax=Variovorax fucosicus TaxID=3053517 RepID=UPI002578F652|nr:phage tail tape measure C-terminal domain-containing protein [Variovorax sp. J22R193]MDM0042148.1 phage tail tape measure C-terminal domain-containing protein [Variovorax sp. J22R193]